MTSEEKLALTPDQAKAFKKMQMAFKNCLKAGIKFYSVLETIYAINGAYVVRIHDEWESSDYNLQQLQAPFIRNEGLESWADDTHYAELRGAGHEL